MKTYFAICALPFALAGCVETAGSLGAPAGGMTMAQKSAALDSAVASIGCDLRFESDYQPVELQTGMTREEIQQVAATKVRKGQAVALKDGGIRLTTGACAEGATPVAVAPALIPAS